MKSRKPGTFQPGNRASVGNKGGGRPPDWIKQEAAKIGDPLAIVRFYWDVANGKDLEQVVTDSGVSIAVPAPVKDRLRAGELYLDRVIGKVTQPMEHTGDIGSRVIFVFPEDGQD